MGDASNPDGRALIPDYPSCDLTTSLPASLPPCAGEGQSPRDEGDGHPTRDSSRSRRRYLLSMAWVRFSSCVETVSNSSSTAEQARSRLSGAPRHPPPHRRPRWGVPGRPHLCGSRWGRGGHPGRHGRAGGGAGRPRRRGRPSCSLGAGRSPDVCVSAPGNCGWVGGNHICGAGCQVPRPQSGP